MPGRLAYRSARSLVLCFLGGGDRLGGGSGDAGLVCEVLGRFGHLVAQIAEQTSHIGSVEHVAVIGAVEEAVELRQLLFILLLLFLPGFLCLLLLLLRR